jgi:hypothetical protein
VKNLYVNRENPGTLMRLDSVDDHFAWISILTPSPSRYAMPIADYDGGVFEATWRKAEANDLDPLGPDTENRPPLRSIVHPTEDAAEPE